MIEFPNTDTKAYQSIAQTLSCEKHLNIWHGSVRSTKTVASLFAWILFLRRMETDYPFLMVGATTGTLRDNVFIYIEMLIGTIWVKNFKYTPSKGLAELTYPHEGDEEPHIVNILVKGANDESAERKIRGLTLAGVYCDEAGLYPDNVLSALFSRISVDGAMGFFTTNPTTPFAKIKKDYIDRESALDLAVFHFTIDDNPYLTEKFKRNLKLETQGVYYQRDILGLWVLAEGVIYDNWKEKNIVDCAQMEFSTYLIGIDYGVINPCVFLLIGLLDGKCYILKEYYYDSEKEKRQKSDQEYLEDFIAFLPEHNTIYIYPDPSASSFILLLERYAASSQRIQLGKTNNKVIDKGDRKNVGGIRFIYSLISQDRICVDRNCKELQKEFNLYCWDSNAKLKGEDVPQKQNDHCVDALRYAIYSHLYKRREPGRQKYYK